jgi:hypothetical protein
LGLESCLLGLERSTIFLNGLAGQVDRLYPEP